MIGTRNETFVGDSQVLAHDAYDVATFAQATEDFGRLGRTVKESGSMLSTAPALLRDLFWSFHKHAPRVAPVATLNPAYELNQQIVEQMLAASEWQELRASGTVGDALNSALATLGVSAKTIAALGEETIRQANLLNELSGEIEQLYAQAESLEELAAHIPDSQRGAELQQQAEQARTTAQEKTAQVEQVQGQLSAGSEKREQQVRQAARQGLTGALQEIEQANDAVKAFGGGAGEGGGTYDGTASRDEMVVLSACNTAQGSYSYGEGIIGMTWAFFIAGVPTTVASQWRVDDSEANWKLMAAFYQNLFSKGAVAPAKAEALQVAMVRMLRTPGFRHPHYWAGFILLGAP